MAMMSSLFRPRRALAALLLAAAACTADAATSPAGGETPSTPPAGTPPATSQTPSSVLGSWVYGALSATDYYNASNGTYVGNGYGTSVLMKFTADGKYEQTIYIQATTYNCHTKVFIYNAGTVKWEATQFRVYPTTGRVRSSDTCNAAFNYDRPDDIARKQGDLYSWAFERNASDGKTYLMIGPNGTTENRSSFRPAN
jgi:hypothetical protein